jgi:hypothetical protein
MTKDSSPFAKTQFHPIGDIYTKEGLLFGLRKPNGEIVINFDHSTSYSRLKDIARITGCEIVTVKGQWTFIPLKTKNVTDSEEEYEEYENDNP